MSLSATLPLNVGATAPEALSLLRQRLLSAQEEAEALIQDMGLLGVSRDRILDSAEIVDTTCGRPLKMGRVLGDESMLWQQCDSLMSRVCRMESLLQTLKITIFQMEMERELAPSHTANPKKQLAALQQESEEKQQVCWREVMKLRDQLQQAYQERDEARTEVQRLCETVEAATAAKMDVALAAEELEIVKLEMNQKLMEMNEQMRQESTCSAEAIKSHSKLLQRVKDLERAVEMERRQGLLLWSDCQVSCVEVQTSRQQLKEEKGRVQQLEEHCQQLTEQTAIKDSLISELKTELTRQQTENSKLLKEGRETRAAAVQAEQRQLLKQLQEQDALLKASGRSIETELQVALTDSVCLQEELEKLKSEHAQLLQSSSIAQETADTQKELFERIIEKLQQDLSTAQKQKEAMRTDLEDSKEMLCLVVTKLEGERGSLETQLSLAKQETRSLSSALQSQQDDNKRLMGKVATLEQQQCIMQQVEHMLKDLIENKLGYEKGKLKVGELEVLQGVHGHAGACISETFENILSSHTGPPLNSWIQHQEVEGREHEPASFKTDRLQAHREIRKHQVEVEKLQQHLTSSNSKNSRALESLQKALDTAKADNKRLAQSLEQAVLTNCSLHSKLEQVTDQYQATITLRDEELYEAKSKISYLSEELHTLHTIFSTQQSREDFESFMKTLHREISELKLTVKDSSSRSSNQAKTTQELRDRMCELEQLVSNQKACIGEQRTQLRQQQTGRFLQHISQKSERVEESIRGLPEKEQDVSKTGINCKQVLSRGERWTSTIQCWETKKTGSHH